MFKRILITTVLIFIPISQIHAEDTLEEMLEKFPNDERITIIAPKHGDTIYTECPPKVEIEFIFEHTYLEGEGTVQGFLFTPKGALRYPKRDGLLGIPNVTMKMKLYQEGEYIWWIGHMYSKDGPAHIQLYDRLFLINSKKAHFNISCDTPPEEEQINAQDIDNKDSLEENINSQNQSEKEKRIKGTTSTIQNKIKETYSNIKDIFNWEVNLENLIQAYLEDLFIVIEPQTEEIEEERIHQKEQTKPFSFPFEKIIGVTQWYGNTAFQQPHTGIDFGASYETIIAPGNGKVIAMGYDTFNGECFSGGNYLILKHENGIHTAYFHIDQYLVKQNEQISKGQEIAISGNSGKWNCQNLKAHLHFETRKGRYQDTHVNPVDYIDIDWNTIPTLGYQNIPGRLSGENPHPTY